ncbi:MAG: DNA ligase D [Betaproteobacteria bacterium]
MPAKKPTASSAPLATDPSAHTQPPAEALRAYAAKRAFDITTEPGPLAPNPPRPGPLLFVVQQHAASRLHWDLRIELDAVLKSWAVPKGPSLDRAHKRLAMQTEDHPFDYAAFEGVIPVGEYGGGNMIVWDCGVYSPDDDGTYWFHDRDAAQARLRAGLEKGKLSIFLRGEKLKGSFALIRTTDAKSWLLLKHKDRFVTTDDVLHNPRSVISGLTVGEIAGAPPRERAVAAQLTPSGPAETLPTNLSPMLADLGEAVPGDAAWMHEPKLDGYRLLAFIDGNSVELRSRRGLDLTRAFPDVVAELAAQSVSSMLVDGEIVAFSADGKPSFNALQNRAQLKTAGEIAAAERATPCVFYAFDLLHFAGVNLRGATYLARRRYLAQCLLPSPKLQVVHAHEDGDTLYAAALSHGFEGIVSKRKDSIYQVGRRSPSWVKTKATHSAEFVVGGYTKGIGARSDLGALLVGYWNSGKLQYAGHVGSGFDDATLSDTKQRFDALRSTRCPFSEKPPLHKPTIWLTPELVAEIRFAEWTPDGHLRAPVFLRLRDDVDPAGIRRPGANAPDAQPTGATTGHVDDVLHQLDSRQANLELTVSRHQVGLTHLDRVYWPADPAFEQPELTKRDLLRYLAAVSPLLLPHLADRPLTMIRMPGGIYGERFYQKHWDNALPDYVDTITVYSQSKREQHAYLVCNNLPTLLWLAQAGTVEFHVWHSRSRVAPDAGSKSTDFASSAESIAGSVLNLPDYLVFDIDPYIYSGHEAPGAEPELNARAFEKGKEVAFWLRELLQGMMLESIVKTSGKTGLHVFVPIERKLDFDTVRQVCETVGRHLMRQHPKEITMEWTVTKRTGKIFMDYNMNVRGKALNVAYSPRGSPGAAVSMPLTWDELADAHPLDYRLTNVIERLRRDGDVWREALTRKQSLGKVLGKL